MNDCGNHLPQDVLKFPPPHVLAKQQTVVAKDQEQSYFCPPRLLLVYQSLGTLGIQCPLLLTCSGQKKEIKTSQDLLFKIFGF